MAESLKNKTVRGVGWSFADSALGQGVTFIVGLILARLLSPDEYGLIGIITIFVTVLNSIVDSGFSNALIRKNNATDKDYNTVFYTNLVFSLVLYVILFFCSPLIARFFDRPELVSLTRVMGFATILDALSLIQNTLLVKKLDFKTRTKASLISAIVSGLVGIVMALLGFGVWALVAQALSRQLLYTICLWSFNRWWPKIEFYWDSFKEMWSFGWKLLVSSLIDTVWKELYQVVVGKFYSPATLGQYTRGKQFASVFSQNLTVVVQRVSYPALAEIQDDKQRLANAYRKVIKTTMFATAVLLFSLGAVAEPLLYCLIGPQWHQAATFLPLICVSMSLYPLHAINLNMLKVQGRSDLFLKLEILKKIIAIFPLLVGIFIDIYWMLVGSIITGVIAFFLNSYYSGKMLGYSSWMQLKDIAPSYTLATLIAFPVFFMKFLPLSNFVILPLQIVVGIGIFFIVCRITRNEEYVEVMSLAKRYISKIHN